MVQKRRLVPSFVAVYVYFLGKKYYQAMRRKDSKGEEVVTVLESSPFEGEPFDLQRGPMIQGTTTLSACRQSILGLDPFM